MNKNRKYKNKDNTNHFPASANYSPPSAYSGSRFSWSCSPLLFPYFISILYSLIYISYFISTHSYPPHIPLPNYDSRTVIPQFHSLQHLQFFKTALWKHVSFFILTVTWPAQLWHLNSIGEQKGGDSEKCSFKGSGGNFRISRKMVYEFIGER